MCNIFLTNCRGTIFALYNELTDNVTGRQRYEYENCRGTIFALFNELTDNVIHVGRQRYKNDIEQRIRPFVSAYVKVPTPTEQTIACKFGITEKEVDVLNRIKMQKKKCFNAYKNEYERSIKA